CNQKAAQVTKATPVQPSTRIQPATPPSTGMQSDTSKPGTPVSPGPAAQPAPSTPQPGNNPSGGRMTDSSTPWVPASELGMAPIGATDPAHQQRRAPQRGETVGRVGLRPARPPPVQLAGIQRHVCASSRYSPVGAPLPVIGSSVTAIARASSREIGTVIDTHARPLASPTNPPPVIGGAVAGMNHS